MEQNTASSSCRNENIITDSSIWRNGPAKLIYDQLGIPEDCQHLNYSMVIYQSKDEEFWGDESPSRGGCDESDHLALAIKTILPPPPEEIERSFNKHTDGFHAETVHVVDCDHVGQVSISGHALCLSQNESNKPTLVSTHPRIIQTINVETRVVEMEKLQAVNALVKEMSQTHDNSFYLDKGVTSQFKNAKLSPQKQTDSDNESFSLVTQLPWENDIVWENIHTNMSNENYLVSKDKQARAGWIPSQINRKACADNADGLNSLLSYENEDLVEGSWETEVIWNADEFRKQFPQPKLPVFDVSDEHIVFKMPEDGPKETQENQQQIVSTCKRVVVQPHTMKSKLILGKTGFIPCGWNKEQLQLEQMQEHVRETQRKHQQQTSSSHLGSKICWNKVTNFNISNDQFYLPKDAITSNLPISNFRHSRLVKEFVPPFILTHLTTDQLRNFHRPKLSTAANAPVPTAGPNRDTHCFKSLTKRICQKRRERSDLMRQGHLILFDQPIDISGRDGEIVLIENCEEYPPLLSQVGMCSEIVNYYKRRSLKEDKYVPFSEHSFGELNYVSSSTSSFPFLGTLESGQLLSAICNNLYRAPIYWHQLKVTDFLLIRSKMTGYLIRDLSALFVAGQQCPLIEVPEPNSVKVRNFLKEFLQVFVYRKYRACLPPEDSADVKIGATLRKNPAYGATTPKVRMDVITKHFPAIPEATIKSILKNSSELQRYRNVTWMVMRSGFPLPSVQDLADMVKPEQVCAYYSLLAAEQRLRDAGLDSMLALPERRQDELLDGKKGRKSIKGLLDAVDGGGNKSHPGKSQQQEHFQSVLGEELLSAPWNTTSSFVAATKGKCMLQLTGSTDPTGCGEGFSYVRVAKKGPSALSGLGDTSLTPPYSGRGRPRKQPLKTGGTDADLRKLSAKSAKEHLKRAGVPDKEIHKLSRWEIIDLLRTLSTEKVMQGETNNQAITKFCRWKSIHSATMNQERYREACQRIFDLQNKVLSSNEVLSSSSEDDDEDDSDEELRGLNGGRDGDDSSLNGRRNGASKKDIEQMGKNIERLLNDEADMERMTHEEEELERLELQKMMLGGIKAKDQDIARRKEALEREKELAQKDKENSQGILTSLMKNPGRVLKISRTFIENGERFVRTEVVRDPVVIAAYLRIRSSKSEEFIKRFLYQADRREKKEQKLKDRMTLSQLKDQVMMEEGNMQRKRKREMDDQYYPNIEAKKKAEKMLRKQMRKCGGCGMAGHMKTSKDCPLHNQEKIDKIMKKREENKIQKTLKFTPPNALPTIPPVSSSTSMVPSISTSETEGDSAESGEDSSTSSSSSSSSSSSGQGHGNLSEVDCMHDSSSSGTECIRSSQEPIVKTDGLKMKIKTSRIQESIHQAQEQEAKEQEVARILATMAMEGGNMSGAGLVARRRISQAERENADYLNDKKYKTTAADRRSGRF